MVADKIKQKTDRSLACSLVDVHASNRDPAGDVHDRVHTGGEADGWMGDTYWLERIGGDVDGVLVCDEANEMLSSECVRPEERMISGSVDGEGG